MNKQQKILATLLWGLLVLVMVGMVVGRRLASRGRSNETGTLTVQPVPVDPAIALFTVPGFSFLDQNEKRISNDDLRGKVWVAQFIFTHCAGPCPMMLGKMKQLQATISEPQVHLVSLTVDPERDTPAVLKEKAVELGADDTRWHFLTGGKQEILDLARGMLTNLIDAKDDQPVLHSEKFFLIDPAGRCRGRYDSNNLQDMQKLTADAKSLALAEKDQSR